MALRSMGWAGPVVAIGTLVMLAASCSDGDESGTTTTTTATTTASTGTSSGGAGGTSSSGGGSATGGNGGAGGMAECSPADVETACGKSTTCRTYSCDAGKCAHVDAMIGTACSEDMGVVCDGKGACVKEHCMDAVKDADETDVDCGGACSPCENDKGCAKPADCKSEFCKDGAGGGGGASPDVCAACTSSTDCAMDRYCDAMGACVPDKKQGETCADGAECPSGSCVDGVCCDTACDGACAACSMALGADMDGTCKMAGVKGKDDAGVCDDKNGKCGFEATCTCDMVGACVPKTFVKQIVSGDSHNCALFNGGGVKCWGGNANGQLGYGDNTNRGTNAMQLGAALAFVNLGTGRSAKMLAAGGTHTCALLDNGSVKCWGANTNGQLGQGSTTILGDGANEMGDNLAAVNLGTNKTAKFVIAGGNHTCAILNDDTTKCWGANGSGQLGYGDTTQRGSAANQMGDTLLAVNLGTNKTAKVLRARGNTSCAILADATVKCWGDNAAGQLGKGSTVALGDSANEMGDSLTAINLGTNKTAKAIGVGQQHVCAILDDDKVKCWGSAVTGQLGQGNTTALGDGANEMGDALPYVNVGTNVTVKAIGVGQGHNCVVTNTDTVKCWGVNTNGQLGLGDTMARGSAPNQMGDNLAAVSLGTNLLGAAPGLGNSHTCMLLTSGAVKCWGLNTSGQLALGDTNQRGSGANQMGDNLPIAKLLP